MKVKGMNEQITVIGGGLAGVEAAWAAANCGCRVTLFEMKGERFSPAHHSENLAELVCSNSLKAKRIGSAAGLLKEEMRRLGSLCVETAYACEVPAGGALAVDRDAFSKRITDKILSHPLISLVRREVTKIPESPCILAVGPLASDAISEAIRTVCGDALSFYDAAAPIVTKDSLDPQYYFTASRYERGGEDDYINCPMNKEEYEAFYDALIHAESAPLHSFDRRKDVYEGCMPIEVMALRGKDTIRYGPLKPVGLRDPKSGHRPWAVLQLRRETKDGALLNLVGFQTNLKFSEQKRVFSMIPALRHAEYMRYGVMHRNTFLDAPRLLHADYSLRARPDLFFAGQITGVEGYMESAQSGLLAGMNLVRRLRGEKTLVLPPSTMMGALSRYISDESVRDFQPMGASFGILPPIEPKIREKKLRYEALSARSLQALENYLQQEGCYV